MKNLKEWRKRRERETRKPSAKVVQMKPETLLERLLRYARLSGSQYIEKPLKLVCMMPSGVVVTVYRKPAKYLGGIEPILYYGEVFFPYRKYGRRRFFDWRHTKLLYERLGQEINEFIIKQK